MTTHRQKFFSSEIDLGALGHSNYEFVDVDTMSDQQLFIDPSLIFTSSTEWCFQASKVINDYFDRFYHAFRFDNGIEKAYLLSHAQEINDTRLGFGNGHNGHGNTAEGLLAKFSGLSNLLNRLDSMSLAADLTVFVPGFDMDGLSDMLTNIIHLQLYNFTMHQLSKYGIKPNATTNFWSWDANSGKWVYYSEMPAYSVGKGVLLLVPKTIVQKRYLYSIDHFFRHVILTRMQQERAFTDSKGKTKVPPKEEVKTEIVKLSDNWKYDFITDFTSKAPDALYEYHKRIPEFYDGRCMTDEELDIAIYGRSVGA